jgi:hypothetical protein
MSTDRVAQDLADAAAVHAAREDIVRALGPLAAAPLDEQAVTSMRRALRRAGSPRVRAALLRVTKETDEQRPHLAVPMRERAGTAARPSLVPVQARAVRSRVVVPLAADGAA